jgi:hypothetical protein
MVPPNVATVLAAGVAALTVKFIAFRREHDAQRKNGDQVENEELEGGDASVAPIGVYPVTVALENIQCVVRDKSGIMVCSIEPSVLK